RIGIAHHAVDLFLSQTRRGGDRYLLFASSSEVASRDVDDTVGVDVERDFDLWNPSRSRRNANQMELAERPIVAGHRAFALQYVDFDRSLIVGRRREDLRLPCWNRRI